MKTHGNLVFFVFVLFIMLKIFVIYFCVLDLTLIDTHLAVPWDMWDLRYKTRDEPCPRIESCGVLTTEPPGTSLLPIFYIL